jgi:hypothetical protein
MKKVVIGMLASAVAALFFVSATPACSSDSCTYSESKCSADPKPTAEQITAAETKCKDEKAKATKCVSEGEAVATCFKDKQVCNAANLTDGVKTLEACKAEYDAAIKCQATAGDGG